ENERRIAAACARLSCPHPYLALMTVAGAPEVWWLNTFASQEEKQQVEAAYARNEGLMAELQALSKRKEAFRRAESTTLTEYLANLSPGALWRVRGARFFVIGTTQSEDAAAVVFESSDAQRFVVRSAHTRKEADRIAGRAGAGSVILAVQPQWSFPDQAWIAADQEFWRSHPA